MNKKALFAFLVSFILIVAVIIINRQSFNKMREYTRWVSHGRLVMARLEKLSNHFKSAQIYSERYAHDSTRKFYHFYKAEADSLKGEIANLQYIVSIDPAQKVRIDTIAKQVSHILPLLMKYNIVELLEQNMQPELQKVVSIQELINAGIIHYLQCLDSLVRFFIHVIINCYLDGRNNQRKDHRYEEVKPVPLMKGLVAERHKIKQE